LFLKEVNFIRFELERETNGRRTEVREYKNCRSKFLRYEKNTDRRIN